MKKDPNAPHIARLEAIMDVLGYGEFGGQKRFADEIGVAYKNFNLQLKGYPLTNTVSAPFSGVSTFPSSSCGSGFPTT